MAGRLCVALKTRQGHATTAQAVARGRSGQVGSRVMNVGKRVGGALYVHREALDLIGDEAEAVATAARLLPDLPWNVAKISRDGVSLLVYEDFDEAAFPALLKSARVDPATGAISIIDYEGRDSPPILHRKETLLRPDDPRIPQFRTLTAEAEARGLFRNSNSIGTKRKWEERLREANLKIVGQRIVDADDKPVKIARHRTAIARHGLSQPMQIMLGLGMIRKDFSVFDYGCGQGDDVALLQANGYQAFGWDPHHAPEGPRREADVVNLGFVINVIENPTERVETIRAAWSFARRALMVAVMPTGKYQGSGLKPYKDGFLSSRGTFQRYYSQEELRELTGSVTGEAPVSLAPGIVAIFRDKELEQEVTYRRRSRATVLSETFQVVSRTRPPRVDRPSYRSLPVRDRIAPQMEAIWKMALEFGRLPDVSEVSPDIIEALAVARVSFDRAVALCIAEFDPATLREAAEARRDDLLVHFALMQFPGAPRYATLPSSIKRDVRTFFGSLRAAMEEARQVLFSAGNQETVREAIQQALDQGLGGMSTGGFRFLASALSRMPRIIRVVVGCAEVIEADIYSYDLLEISMDNAVVTGIRCDDFSRAMPLITDCTIVDLKALRRKVLRLKGQVLYLKGRYLPVDDPTREGQLKVDEKLLRAGIVSEDGKGPDAASLMRILRARASTA